MLFLILDLAQAGGWTQSAQDHYVKLGGRAIPGADFFGDAGDTSELPSERYLDLALELYGEYGLTDNWTLVGQAIPIGFASLAGEQTAYAGVYQVGVRRRLLRGRHNLSVQVDVGYTPPLGETDLFLNPPSGDDGIVYRYLPTQSGAQGDVLLGYGVGLGSVWLAAQVGAAGFTNGDIAPAVLGYGQFGYTTPRRNRLTFTVPYRIHVTQTPDTNLSGAGQTDFAGVRLEFELTFGDSGWGVSTGFVGALFASGNEASLTLPLYLTHSSPN